MNGSADKQSSDNAQQEPSKMKALLASPWFKSAFLHSMILASLLVSFNFSAKPLKFVNNDMSAPSSQPQIVQATFIDSNVVAQKQREKAQAEAAAKQRQQEKLKQERDERARKKRIADEKKKREAEKREAEKKEQERQNRLEQERIKEQQVAERLKQEAQQKAADEQMQRELQQELADQLAKEQQQMSQANRQRIMSEKDKYSALMNAKIQQYINFDGLGGQTCEVNIRLAPDGLILKFDIVSGDNAICLETDRALIRAGSLPMSKDPSVNAEMRNITLEIRPERR